MNKFKHIYRIHHFDDNVIRLKAYLIYQRGKHHGRVDDPIRDWYQAIDELIAVHTQITMS